VRKFIIYWIVAVCVLSVFATNCFAMNQDNGKQLRGLASKLVAPRHQPSPENLSTITALSSYCLRRANPRVGSPAIKLSVVLVFPQKRSNGPCRSYDGRVDRSILLFPGYGFSKITLSPIAAQFAHMGFVSVLVDLPGQGQSGGAHVGYGFLESRYVSSLINFFYSRHEIGGRLSLLGISYGASVAIDSAALNHRVSNVVAIAPFARIVPTIKRYARADDLLSPQLLKGPEFHRIIAGAEKTLGYKFVGHNPLDFARKIKVPVLYIAGSRDNIAPLSEIKSLAKNTSNASVVVLNGYDHYKLGLDANSLVDGVIKHWMHPQKEKHASWGGSYAAGIDCHLVPTPKCWIMGTVRLERGGKPASVSNASIILKTNNICIQKGTYDGKVEIKKGDWTVATRAVKLVVKHDKVTFLKKSVVKSWLEKNIKTGDNIVHWESNKLLDRGALPLKVLNLSKKHGSIKAVMTFDGHSVASSTVHVRPAKGCWIHEQKCQPY
jgi:pimeloyl-ACP methyl ester carboxylesterase